MRAITIVGALLIASVAIGCSSSTPATPSPITSTGGGGGGTGDLTVVSILGGNDAAAFQPPVAIVAPGGSVAWMNSDGENVVHRIVADDGTFDTGDLGFQAQSAAVTVTSGRVPYHCAIHQSETGVVTTADQATGYAK
jgi:plastocyanin